MRPQKEDLVDRCKLEVRQHVETKHTNRSIAFLCLALSLAIGARLWYNYQRRSQLKSISIKWPSIMRVTRAYCLASIPPGKYLFSFRTQKSSLVGAIILR